MDKTGGDTNHQMSRIPLVCNKDIEPGGSMYFIYRTQYLPLGDYMRSKIKIPENPQFASLIAKAGSDRYDDRYADAAYSYERALAGPGGTEDERLEATVGLGRCYLFLGKISWATECFGTAYKAIKYKISKIDQVNNTSTGYDRHECIISGHEKSALISKANHISSIEMQNLRALREADLDSLKMRTQLSEIENRLVGLHETQKASLLLEKAILLFYLEDYDKALDIAEESYSVAKLHGSDYPRQYHAMMVARYSRKAGNYDRTREVLDDYRVQGSSPYSKVQMWIEQIRLFLEVQPPKIQEAVVVADNISHNLGALTTSRIRTEAFCEMGKSYLSAKMYNKGIDALCQVREISLNDHTDHRRYLLRKGLECLTDCKRISDMDSDVSPKISRQIAQLNDELENAYGSSDPEKTIRDVKRTAGR